MISNPFVITKVLSICSSYLLRSTVEVLEAPVALDEIPLISQIEATEFLATENIPAYIELVRSIPEAYNPSNISELANAILKIHLGKNEPRQPYQNLNVSPLDLALLSTTIYLTAVTKILPTKTAAIYTLASIVMAPAVARAITPMVTALETWEDTKVPENPIAFLEEFVSSEEVNTQKQLIKNILLSVECLERLNTIDAISEVLSHKLN